MTTLPTFARMLFRSPLVGTASFLLSAPFLLPLAGTLWLMHQPAVADSLSAANAQVIELIAWLAATLGAKQFEISSWIAPVSYLFLVPGIIAYAYAAQRIAMRIAGTARRAEDNGALARNLGEWVVIIALLQGGAILLVALGAAGVAVTVAEISRTLGLHRLPELPVLFGTGYDEFGRAFWNDYKFLPMLCVGVLGAFFLFGGRYMALLSAFLEGNLRGGVGMGLACIVCSLLFGYLLYGALAGGFWGWNLAAVEIGLPIATVTIGQVLALHLALFWNWMSAAAAYGARREVDRCIEDLADGYSLEGVVVEGAMRDVPPDAESDQLIQQLRDWEARRAA
ncbi:MAG: hypothetical protein AAGG47_20730 [Pseudomonadota bacterium]